MFLNDIADALTVKQIREVAKKQRRNAIQKSNLNEYAPSLEYGGGDDDGFSEETLKQLATEWWHGDADHEVERTLRAAGWTIGQDEGNYENGGVFVVQQGDINGDSYLSWPAEELEGLAEEAMASDTNFTVLGKYKNYTIEVRKKPFRTATEQYYIAQTQDSFNGKQIKAKGATAKEAGNRVIELIDQMLNAAQKVTGGATIDFNVKFATDILNDPRQQFYGKIENIGGEPKLVIAGNEMLKFGKELVQLGFKPSTLRSDPDSETTTPLPGIGYTTNQLKNTGLIANGRYVIGNMRQDDDGNKVFDLTYHSTVHTKSDKQRLKVPALTVGTTRADEDSWHGTGDAWHGSGDQWSGGGAAGESALMEYPMTQSVPADSESPIHEAPARIRMLKRLSQKTGWDLSDLEHMTDRELLELYNEKVIRKLREFVPSDVQGTGPDDASSPIPGKKRLSLNHDVDTATPMNMGIAERQEQRLMAIRLAEMKAAGYFE
jgi:hypothetical protein